jgi:hypothetical protein
MNLSCEMKMGMLDDLRNQALGRYAYETAAIVGTGGSLSSHFRGVTGERQASHRISGNFLWERARCDHFAINATQY